MAIERRVKPSERARQAIVEKRKLFLIGGVVVALLVAAVIGFVKLAPSILYGEPLPWSKDSGSVAGNDNSVSRDAVKAMLEQTVSYTGTWYEDTQVGFQAYIPGTEKYTYDNQVSTIMYKNSGGTAVYGIVVGDKLPTLQDDATKDTKAVLGVTVNQITPDISSALYGANFNASFDVSVTTLGDKTPAIYVVGDMNTKMSLQPEGNGSPQTVEYNYPMCGVAFVRNDVPVMVWGVVDSDDIGEARRLPDYMAECASILSSITADKSNSKEG